MTVQEICDYFKNEVYSAHPEYDIEPNVIDGLNHFYLTVHLSNENCYCFLVLPDVNNQPFDKIMPSKNHLKEFEQLYNSPKCVLKKVFIINKSADNRIEHRTYTPDHFEEN